MKPTRPKANANDPYLAKIVKFIPVEIVAAYVAISGFIKALPLQHQFRWFAIVSLFLLLVTPFWLIRTTGANLSQGCLRHAFAGTIAFAAWVFATGGPFQRWQMQPDGSGGWYCPAVGSIVLILVCVAIPLFASGLKEAEFDAGKSKLKAT
jgi:hypothetical protein